MLLTVRIDSLVVLLHDSNANLCTTFSVINFSLPDYYLCGRQEKMEPEL